MDNRYIDMLQQGFMKQRKPVRAKKPPQAIASELSEQYGISVVYAGGRYAVPHPEGHTNYFSSAKEAKQAASWWKE